MAIIVVKCDCCKGSGEIKTHEGNPVECPYCRGLGRRKQSVPDPTHRMGDWHSEVLAPTGTPRFYSVRECSNCGEEEWSHAAGHFFHGLLTDCKADGWLGERIG